MKKNHAKIIIIIGIVILATISVWYSNTERFSTLGTRSFYDAIIREDTEFQIDEIEATIVFSDLSDKTFALQEKANVEKVVDFLKNINTRQEIFEETIYDWTGMEQYHFYVRDIEKNQSQFIIIFNDEHFQVNSKKYRIIGNVDWSKFYNLLVVEYEGDNEEFYKNYQELKEQEQLQNADNSCI